MERFELIEAYLADELAQEDREAFEKRLQLDLELAEELRLHQTSHQVLQASQQTYYKNFLKGVEEEFSQPKVHWLMDRRFQMAAVILLLVAAAITFFTIPREKVPSYADYAQPYPNYLSARGGAETDSEVLIQALEAYDLEKYAEASELFAKVLEAQPEIEGIAFYKGISHLMEGQYTSAIHAFDHLPTNSTYTSRAKFYRAIALGLNGQDTEAQEILKLISEDEKHPYQQKALELIR